MIPRNATHDTLLLITNIPIDVTINKQSTFHYMEKMYVLRTGILSYYVIHGITVVNFIELI